MNPFDLEPTPTDVARQFGRAENVTPDALILVLEPGMRLINSGSTTRAALRTGKTLKAEAIECDNAIRKVADDTKCPVPMPEPGRCSVTERTLAAKRHTTGPALVEYFPVIH